MNRKSVFFFTVAVIGVLLVSTISKNAESKKEGTPVEVDGGYSGGTFENGRTCISSDCHTGNASYRDSIISVSIGPEGYRQWFVYDVTVTLSEPGINRFGFQASPQDINGNPIGKLISTSARTQKNLLPNWITHTEQSIDVPGNSNTWTFQWQAPGQVGLGEVYFFVAANAANGDDEEEGDMIFFDTIIIPEVLNNSVPVFFIESLISVYPNPTKKTLLIAFDNVHSIKKLEAIVYDLGGRIIQSTEVLRLTPGKNFINLDLVESSSGLRILELKSLETSYLKKFVQSQ